MTVVQTYHGHVQWCRHACAKASEWSSEVTAVLKSAVQLLESDRNLSQYSIGRGDTRLVSRLSRKQRTKSAPPGGLPTVTEHSTKLNDWRQRFIEVLLPPSHSSRELSHARGAHQNERLLHLTVQEEPVMQEGRTKRNVKMNAPSILQYKTQGVVIQEAHTKWNTLYTTL